MNTAAKGRRNEHRSMAIFYGWGCICVRSAGSRGLFDFVAFDDVKIYFVQVKSTRAPGPAERQRLADLVVPVNAEKLVHVWRPYAREPEVLVL